MKSQVLNWKNMATLWVIFWGDMLMVLCTSINDEC